MTQQDKELLLKDLCARLPYGVKVEIKSYDNEEKPWFGELSCKDLDCFLHDVVYTSIRPYLRPRESMTAEEEREFQKIKYSYHFDEHSYILFDWLKAHHFDYRELIEKGLAIEAPEGMYN